MKETRINHTEAGRSIVAAAVRAAALALPVLLAGCAGSAENSPLVQLGRSALSMVFVFGGIAAAIALSVIGVKMIIANATGSSYATAQGIMALLGAGAGLLIMLLGPSIAEALINAVAGVPKNIVIPTTGQ